MRAEGRGPSAVTLLENELKRVETGARFRRTLRSTLVVLTAVAAVAVLAATLVFPVLRIYGTSMAPALNEGEVVVAIRTADARRGEPIAFYYGNKVLIKRCIGTAGDIIDMDEAGNVFRNGQLLDEPYLERKARGECDAEFPCQVPDGRIFVMGDQRETSIDSRNTLIGCIAPEQIIGRVALRIWPLDEIGAVS